jgi:lipopolysaccharide/colanic/teichoic acid biosynthesis glycosyltransferase
MALTTGNEGLPVWLPPPLHMNYSNYNPAGQKLTGAAFCRRSALDFASGFTAKRLYDVFFSFCGLLLLCPLFIVIGALVKLADGGDIFYRQVRVGRGGREFLICKFRTMLSATGEAGPLVTKNGDARITRIGRILRKTKLDELPQLWNVLKGEMSLVGPRPEVPRYVRHYTPEQRAVLRFKPGITDLASLCFRNEEALLRNADDLEEFYLRHCLPRKLLLNRDYAGRANLFSDTWIILQTICPYWTGVLACYGIILAVSFWLSCALIYNFAPLPLFTFQFWRELCLTLGLQLACLTLRKQWRGLLSYFSFPELRQVGAALGLAGVGLLALSVAGDGHPPPNFILVNTLLSFYLLAGFRVLLRRWRERSEGEEGASVNPPTRVGIIGAGRAGAQLALELTGNRNSGRMAVAFFDDDFHKWQKSIHDVPVIGMPECLLDSWEDKLDEVVITLPDAPADRLREIEQLLRKTNLKVCLYGMLPRQFPEAAADGVIYCEHLLRRRCFD